MERLDSRSPASAVGGLPTPDGRPVTNPPLDEPGLVEMLTRRPASLDCAHVHPLGALTVGLKGERLAAMAQLAQAGCVGFFQGDAELPDPATLLQAMRYAATLGFTVWQRPQDTHLPRPGVAH